MVLRGKVFYSFETVSENNQLFVRRADAIWVK